MIADSHCVADDRVISIFSQPELLDKANLTVTSLYELVNKAGIKNITGFMNQFISTERESDKNVH